MDKESTVVFSIFFPVFLLCAIINAVYLDNLIQAIIDSLGTLEDLLLNLGVFGIMMTIISIAFVLVAFLAFFKMLDTQLSSLIAFCVSTGLFILVVVLYSLYVNDIVAGIWGTLDILEVIGTLGTKGILLGNLTAVGVLFMMGAVIKLFKNK